MKCPHCGTDINKSTKKIEIFIANGKLAFDCPICGYREFISVDKYGNISKALS